MKYKNKKNLSILNRKAILWVAVGLFIALQVLFAIQTTTSGANLSDLETQEKMLTEKHRELTSALVESTSLIEMRARSENLGFFKPENTIYLNAGESVAKIP